MVQSPPLGNAGLHFAPFRPLLQKIRTIELDGKTIKLQIVRSLWLLRRSFRRSFCLLGATYPPRNSGTRQAR